MRIIYALSLGIVLFSGCGKKSGKDSQSSGPAGAVTVTGQLVLPQGSASTLPDQLVALPLISAMSGGGSAGGSLSLAISKQQVSGDGAYSVGLQSSMSNQKTAAFSLNEVTDRLAESYSSLNYVVGGIRAGQPTTAEGRYAETESMTFVGLGAGNDNFINFPVGDAASNELNLGRTTVSGSDAKSEFEVSSNFYNLPDSAIQELVGLSSSLKGAKNTYINQDGYLTTPYFAWLGSRAAVASQAFTPVEDVVPGSVGFGIYFTNHSSNPPLLKDACAGNLGTTGGYTLTPPEAIVENATGQTRTLLDSNNNSGSVAAEDSNGRFSCAQAQSQTQPSIYIYGYEPGASSESIKVSGFNWGGSDGYKAPLPAGKWTLKYNGSTVGLYDLAAASPLKNGISRVYMPSVKVTANSSGVISKVELRFYLYDRASQAYELVTDLQTLKKVVESLSLDLNVYSKKSKQSHVPISVELGDASGVFTVNSSQFGGQTWTIGDLSGNGGVLAVAYTMYGYSMRTEYRR